MGMKFSLTCPCGHSLGTISENSSGTKICPRCRTKVQYRVSGGRIHLTTIRQ
jgi:hypothetical protein